MQLVQSRYSKIKDLKYTVKQDGKKWIVISREGRTANSPHATEKAAIIHCRNLNEFFGDKK